MRDRMATTVWSTQLLTSVMVLSALLLAASAQSAAAQSTSNPDWFADPADRRAVSAADEDFETERPLGLSFEVVASSAYAWRGANYFADKPAEVNEFDKQANQYLVGTYRIMWAPPESILFTGVEFAHRIADDPEVGNSGVGIIETLNDAGFASHFKLWAGLDMEVEDDVFFTLKLTYWVYPFAEKVVAGLDVPHYLDPLIGVRTRPFGNRFEWGITGSYFTGLNKNPNGPRAEGPRHFFARVFAGEPVEAGRHTSFYWEVGFGYKRIKDLNENENFVWHLDGVLGWRISLTDNLFLRPALHVGWTNIKGIGITKQVYGFVSLAFGGNF
jgi:hypothetical protein